MNIFDSPKECTVSECKFKNIRVIFEQFHYKGGHMGGGISWCLAMYAPSGLLVGGAVMGKPRHEFKYGVDVIEIRRMALLDDCPRNSESYFLGKIIRFLKSKGIKKVLSYADASVGHNGTIYKAANFKLIGKTSPSKHIFWKGKRYHPRSLTIERPYSYELREAIKSGEAKLETGLPKLIYIYEIHKNIKPPKPINLCRFYPKGLLYPKALVKE